MVLFCSVFLMFILERKLKSSCLYDQYFFSWAISSAPQIGITLIFFILLFYVYRCFAYMYICVSCACLVPREDRRGHHDFSKWQATHEDSPLILDSSKILIRPCSPSLSFLSYPGRRVPYKSNPAYYTHFRKPSQRHSKGNILETD